MPTINAERLLADLRHLATFGKVGTGVCRAAMSPEDIEARHWLVERMCAAGLDAEIDRVGNVLGRSRRRGPALLIGSHSDSQPRGGWLDGSLGVIYGLEIARALGECDETADCAVDVVSFQDEEGTLYGCLGSRAFGGKLTAADIAAASRRAARPLRRAEELLEALRRGTDAGLHPADYHISFLEVSWLMLLLQLLN